MTYSTTMSVQLANCLPAHVPNQNKVCISSEWEYNIVTVITHNSLSPFEMLSYHFGSGKGF